MNNLIVSKINKKLKSYLMFIVCLLKLHIYADNEDLLYANTMIFGVFE